MCEEHDEIECKKCGWQGLADELTAHPDDDDKSVEETRFVVCPGCNEPSEFEDVEY